MKNNYYNEFNPFAAQWLRNLIELKLIPAGYVDDRSIVDVRPEDLKGYHQCHFFAGIGGWAYATKLAGLEHVKGLWTGSCPCQPFSTAGRRKGKQDERHLWPEWFRLIRGGKPSIVYGEQVAAAIAHGWWDDVANDLEGQGYEVGAAVLPACSVGAPHKRDRLWFVANQSGAGLPKRNSDSCEKSGSESEFKRLRAMGDSEMSERSKSSNSRTGWNGLADASGSMGDTEHNGQPTSTEPRSNRAPVSNNTERPDGTGEPSGTSGYEHVADTNIQGSQGRIILPECADQRTPWAHGMGWLQCPDGKARPVEPSICLLAHGVSGRVAISLPAEQGESPLSQGPHWYSRAGALQGFGNAIVPQVAAEFMRGAI